MSSRTGASSLVSLLSIVGLVGVGVTGFKLVGDCSPCSDSRPAVTAVSTEPKGDCALCPGAETIVVSQPAVEVVPVVATTPAEEKDGCCKDEGECCGGGGPCCDAEKSESEKSGCEAEHGAPVGG